MKFQIFVTMYKKAQAESTDGILSFTFNCPSVEASGVFVTARGKFCPIYEDARGM